MDQPATQAVAMNAAVNLPVYPYRESLYEELHTRPSPKVECPVFVTHLAMLRGEDSGQSEHELINSLCRRFSVNPPEQSASCFYQSFGGFEFRWERHTEFSTYTFIRPDDGQNENEFGLAFIPKDWIAQLPGELVVALNMRVSDQEMDEKQEQHFFEGQKPLGSMVANRKARVLTSFRLHSDGMGRCLVQNNGLNAHQTGRMVQRILELETYRLMALIGLPVARSLSADVYAMETQLAKLNQQLTQIRNESDERIMLHELSIVAAKVEQYRSDTNYRFSATNAYYALVRKRLDQLFEQKISGIQTMREFLERRLTPAIRTCDAIRDRLEDLSRRIHRTSSLLRTRVELSIESHNQKLLASMDRRSSLQLRLQQTVEGLSVVAIGYYLLGLLGYVFEGLATWGWPINKSIASAVAMPIVLILVYLAVRSVRKQIKGLEKKAKKLE